MSHQEGEERVRARNEGPGGCVPWEEHQALEQKLEEAREALVFTVADIQRRMHGDESIDAPYDEDLAEAQRRCEGALASLSSEESG